MFAVRPRPVMLTSRRGTRMVAHSHHLLADLMAGAILCGVMYKLYDTQGEEQVEPKDVIEPIVVEDDPMSQSMIVEILDDDEKLEDYLVDKDIDLS